MNNNKDLDNDWVELIKYAKKLGITIEEIKLYFKKRKNPFNKNG